MSAVTLRVATLAAAWRWFCISCRRPRPCALSTMSRALDTTRTGLESDQAWPIGVSMLSEPGAGDGEADAGLAGGAGIAVGHEARALLVAGQDVA